MISTSNPHCRGNKSGRGFRDIQERTRDEEPQIWARPGPPPANVLGESIHSIFLVSRSAQSPPLAGYSSNTLAGFPWPPHLKQHPFPNHIPGFMDFTVPGATEVILFVYLCACLLAVFAIQEGRLHNSSSLAWIVQCCVHPLC